GCVAKGYGIESGSQTLLNNMNKQVTVEQAEKALKDAVNVGIYPIMQMMYGYPGETRKTLQETVEFVKKLPHVLPLGGLSTTTPLPGAELYYYSLKRGLIKDEEKYLEQLSAGYMQDGTRPLVNFTEFDDEDFYRLKWETESAIWVYQKRKYPLLRLVKDFLRVILPHIQKYGYKQTIRRTVLLLNRKFDITLNKKRKEK
ncbi:MAG: radical SAM protein, partial [Candidatus Aminicenantaceae bacterium]